MHLDHFRTALDDLGKCGESNLHGLRATGSVGGQINRDEARALGREGRDASISDLAAAGHAEVTEVGAEEAQIRNVLVVDVCVRYVEGDERRHYPVSFFHQKQIIIQEKLIKRIKGKRIRVTGELDGVERFVAVKVKRGEGVKIL